jgi:uncharacterized protein YggE
MEPATLFPWKKYSLYLAFGLVALFLYSWITSPLIVTVTGTGEISAKAETATLTFTLSSQSQLPQDAVAALKTNISKVKENLKSNGIPESDIYESQISVLPASAVTSGGTGFQATTSMGIKTGQINNLDGITNSLYALGAAVVTQPVLSVGDINNLEKQAYNMALKDANKKSWQVALSNWKLIKKMVLIEQSTTQPTSTVTTKADTVSQVEKNLTPDDGLIKISKVVSVSYKMW